MPCRCYKTSLQIYPHNIFTVREEEANFCEQSKLKREEIMNLILVSKGPSAFEHIYSKF
jgi:hypothetical protein